MAEEPVRVRDRAERRDVEGAPRRIEVEIHPSGAEVQVPTERLRQLEAISVKLIDRAGHINTVLIRLNSDLSRFHSGVINLKGGIEEAVKSIGRARGASEDVQQKMRAQADAVSMVNRELQRMAREFNYGSIVFRGMREATRQYIERIASMALLPYAFAKGIVQSIDDTIKMARQVRRELVAFDRAVMNSINVLNALAERGGLLGRVASLLRAFPVAYARITRGIPRVFRRVIRRLRRPRVAEAIRLMELGKPLNESLQEQRRMSRLLVGVLGGVTAITGFFTRLLRYVWEILVVQKLGGLMGALGGALGRILTGAGLGTIIATLKSKLIAFASMIGSAVSSIGSALGSFLSKIGSFVTGTAGGLVLAVTAVLTAGGKIAEALGVNADVIGRTAQGLRARAEEAERHGNVIASALFNTASSIHGFAQQVWIAGDQAKEWLSTHIPVIGGALGELAQGLLHGVSAFIGGVGAIVGLMGEGAMKFQEFVTWLSGGISDFINRAQGAFNDFINWASSGLRGLWEGFTNTLGSVLGGIGESVRGAWDGLISGLRGIADRLGLGGVFDRVSQATSGLTNMFQGAVDAVKGFIHALTGRNPGVIMHLEELGSGLRRTSALIAGVREMGVEEAGYYGARLIDLVSDLIIEVRELRRDISKLRPEVNVNVRTTESAYIRR